MILVITHKQDYTADFLINKFNQRGIAYYRLNCEDVLSSKINVKTDLQFQFSVKGTGSFSAVWFRRTSLPALDVAETSKFLFLKSEFDSFLKNLFSVIEAKWLSDPWQVYRAENKLLQLKIARQLGFSIPETLVTTDKAEVVSFYNEFANIIVKPISVTRSDGEGEPIFIYTSRVEKEHIDRIDQFDLTPCIFQREIEKLLEIRVTVVGDRAFAASVDSQKQEETKVDWRRKPLSFSRFELPENIASKCIRLVKKLGLLFGAIDIILSPDGSYTFLEINPNGQWVWIEKETGLLISEAIINELTNV